jgi:hypothetical protein
MKLPHRRFLHLAASAVALRRRTAGPKIVNRREGKGPRVTAPVGNRRPFDEPGFPCRFASYLPSLPRL